MRSCCLSLGNNWQTYRLLVQITATWCKASEANLAQSGVQKYHFSLKTTVFVKVPPVGSGGQRSIQLSYGRTRCATAVAYPRIAAGSTLKAPPAVGEIACLGIRARPF